MSEYSRHEYKTTPQVDQGEVAAAAGLGLGLCAAVITGLGLAVYGTAKVASKLIAPSLVEINKQAIKHAEQLKNSRPEKEAFLKSLNDAPLLKAAVIKAAGLMNQTSIENADKGLMSLSPKQMKQFIHKGHNNLLQAQAKVLRSKFTDSLEEMGYQIKRPKRLQKSAVWIKGVNRADGQAITVCLAPQKESVELDLSGFAPGVCTQARKLLMEKMERRGVRLELKDQNKHDRKGGGLVTQTMNDLTKEDNQSNRNQQNNYTRLRLPRQR